MGQHWGSELPLYCFEATENSGIAKCGFSWEGVWLLVRATIFTLILYLFFLFLSLFLLFILRGDIGGRGSGGKDNKGDGGVGSCRSG